MKAIILKAFGGVENLVITDLPIPDISDNEVLIKIKAIGINPVDIKTRKGRGLAGSLKDQLPKTHLALKPGNVSHEEAAAASLAALTAWQLLKEHAGIKPGHKVLIHSAAGGVGHYAVQMVKYLGADVAGTASGKNKNFVLSIGASQHIDYEKQAFEDVLHDLDFVLDTIGGENTDRSLKVLKPGGTIICLPSGACENIVEKAREKGMTGSHFIVKSNGGDMKEISDKITNSLTLKSVLNKFG